MTNGDERCNLIDCQYGGFNDSNYLLGFFFFFGARYVHLVSYKILLELPP